jgi:uncharacterized protein YjiS (DUF1127 family)
MNVTQMVLTAASFTTQAFEGLLDLIRHFMTMRRERKAIKETEKALMKLSNKDLDDIGISRGDIWSIARRRDVIDQCMTNKNLRGWV